MSKALPCDGWNQPVGADTKEVMGELTDAALWRRAAAGETAAFGTIFERHARTVYNYCFRRSGDWALAEELTAIVFLEAWRRRQQIELERDEAIPWLLGVATNVIRNLRRSQRRYRAALERLPREPSVEFATEVDERVDDERQMRAALRALCKLPRVDQDVLALCVWEELTYEQAALALGVPVGTVRSRLFRARARLRELTENGGHEWDECIATEETT
jgi:RNA polymerase sigma factor (sigma-70 family)